MGGFGGYNGFNQPFYPGFNSFNNSNSQGYGSSNIMGAGMHPLLKCCSARMIVLCKESLPVLSMSAHDA